MTAHTVPSGTTAATRTGASAELASRIRGRVLTVSDADWDDTRQVFNLTTDLRPALLALPEDAADVAAAVRWADARGVPVAAQATGHNAAAHGRLDDALVVDVRRLREVTVDADARRVRVGAGVRWRDVVPRLSELGLAALHGSSPLVGIAGYSLGGGMGWLARKHGLQTNSVTALELVTADGDLRRVDAGHDPELFWALRGGNGNFGVVTAIEFEVYPVAELYAGGLFFPLARAAEVLRAWTGIAPALPEETMTWTSLMQFPDDPAVPTPLRGGAFTVFHVAHLGAESEGAALVDPVRALGPVVDTCTMVPPAALADMAMDPPEPVPIRSTTALVADLPESSLEALLAVVGDGSGSPLPLVQIRHLGGALGRVSPGAGARATLPGGFCVFALGVVVDEASAAEVDRRLTAIDEALADQRVGQYPNFVEHPADPVRFFDADTWQRLRRAKETYDPEDRFRGNHRIPPAGTEVALAG